MINNDNNRSLEALPMSPCTDGSLGFDHQYINSNPAKVVNAVPAAVEEVNEEKTHVVEEHAMEHMHETSHVAEEHAVEHIHDKSNVTEEHVVEHMEERNHFIEEHAVEHKEERDHIAEEHALEHKDEEDEPVEEMHQAVEHRMEEETEHGHGHVHEDIEEMTEMTCTMAVSSSATTVDETTEVTFTTTTTPETMATESPHRTVKYGMPATVQSRGLSSASLALKKKQAAEDAAAAIKSVSVNVPETDSIADRIKIFGGGSSSRVAYRKVGVRDMIKKYKDVEDKSHSEIEHVVRGHNESEPQGVCSAYSLSTASRPLRPTPRRKMSHEMADHETREVVKAFGGMARHEDEEDRLGVSQESVHSVKNAKNIFETLARAKSGAQV